MHRDSPGEAILRRWWLIVLLAALGAIAGWVFASQSTRQYERTATFLLRPRSDLPPAAVPDAVRGLAQQDSQLVRTVSTVLATDWIIGPASALAFGRPLDAGYSVVTSVSPASDVIVANLRGPDPARLVPLTRSFAAVASSWVGRTYRAYELDTVESQSRSGPVSPNVGQTVVLGALLGAMLGICAALAEVYWRRRSPASKAGPANGHATAQKVPRTEARQTQRERARVGEPRAPAGHSPPTETGAGSDGEPGG